MTRSSRNIVAVALAAGLLAGGPGGVGHAQPLPATLIADDIRFDQGTSAITARGGVEIFYDGVRLRAGSITYSDRGDQITVEGPITLTDASGNSVIVAEFAELSSDLQDGVLQSARLVLDRQLQIAATQIDRSDGRYTQMYQAVASSCEVCFDNPTPLWEIRAERVVHDAEEQQLYFDNAQFRVMGVPVAWLPRMRLPDPTLRRATGFLAPTIRADDVTGTSLKLPYFILLNDHSDLTVTPWIGFGRSQTVELRYRRAFRSGTVEALGAVTADGLTDQPMRGYVFATGQFDTGHDIDLTFGLQAVSDNGYLATYGLPNPDLLESFVRLTRVNDDSYSTIGATIYESLRDGDENQVLPTRVVDAEHVHRFTPPVVDGSAEFRFSTIGYQRLEDTPGTTVDGLPEATDSLGFSAEIDWQRTDVMRNGLLLTYQAALTADFYSVRQDVDPSLNGETVRLTPYVGVELRWPMQRVDQSGISHLLEPVVQLVWSQTTGDDVPVEDSAVVDFDEGNLLALDRFPGNDRREQGRRANFGLGYTRVDPDGWSAGVTAGFVLREDDLQDLDTDYLLAAQLTLQDSLLVVGRSVFDSDFSFTSSEVVLSYMGEYTTVNSTFVWLEADPDQGRPDLVAEWVFDAGYTFANAWEAGVNWRYDVGENEPTRAGLSLGYVNECVDVEFSLSRRYTSASSLEAATEFGLTVSLAGFGAGRDGRSQTRTCNS